MGILDDPRSLEVDTLADSAERAMQRGDAPQAQRLYAEAAAIETQIAMRAPADEPRVRGLLAVSATALWYKAARYDDVERIARIFLAAPESLAEQARRELRALIERAWRAKDLAAALGERLRPPRPRSPAPPPPPALDVAPVEDLSDIRAPPPSTNPHSPDWPRRIQDAIEASKDTIHDLLQDALSAPLGTWTFGNLLGDDGQPMIQSFGPITHLSFDLETLAAIPPDSVSLSITLDAHVELDVWLRKSTYGSLSDDQQHRFRLINDNWSDSVVLTSAKVALRVLADIHIHLGTSSVGTLVPTAIAVAHLHEVRVLDERSFTPAR